MIVRTLEEAEQSDRRVVSNGWESTRLLLKSDAMGFSFHITTIYAGADSGHALSKSSGVGVLH